MRIVSESALIRRINRRIGGYERDKNGSHWPWGERLCKARGYFAPWGTPTPYYTVDCLNRGVTGTVADLEEYGREVGALAGHERLGD